jgi:hypothetical protein
MYMRYLHRTIARLSRQKPWPFAGAFVFGAKQEAEGRGRLQAAKKEYSKGPASAEPLKPLPEALKLA